MAEAEEPGPASNAVALAEPPHRSRTDSASQEIPPALAAPPRDELQERLLLPLMLPILSIAALVVLVLNISRVLLASDSGSVIVGTLITVMVLGGAAAISASPRLRTSTLTLIVSLFVVVVVGSGLLTLGPSEGGESEAGGYKSPSGPPVATLSVDALLSNRFQSSQFGPLPSGTVLVKYQGTSTHTLVFDDPSLSGFILKVPQGPDSGKVLLRPGEYTIYCTIPGHRAQGMEAKVQVQ